MDEKEPTQQTQPKQGEPIEIPVPTRDEIDAAIAKVAKPIVENDNPAPTGALHPLPGTRRGAAQNPPGNKKRHRKGKRS